MPQLDDMHAGLAALVDGDSFIDIPLFTGERQTHTDSGEFAAEQDLPALTVLARNASGLLVPAQHGEAAPLGVPVAISMVDVKTGVGETMRAPCYWSGCFNPERLFWHASYDTDAKKKSAFGEPSVSNIAIKAMG